MPVTSFPGGNGESVLALDARAAADVALLRPDLSRQPVARLWRQIIPARPGPGLELPGQPARLALTAAAGMPGRGPRIGGLTVNVTVQDCHGITYTVPAGGLPDDGRPHRLTAQLKAAPGSQPPGPAGYPLRLLAISLSYQMLPFPAPPNPSPAAERAASDAERLAGEREATLAISALSASPAPGGPLPAPFSDGGALRSWTARASSVEVPASPRAAGIPPRVLSWRRGAGGGLQLVFIPGTGHLLTMAGQPPLPVSSSLTLTAAGPALTPLPAIATDSFLRASHTAVGSVLFETASQVVFPVQIVASVRAVPRDLPAGTAVTSAGQLAAGLLGNPLSAVPQQAVLAIAVAAALLAALGMAVSVAASVAERRTRSALLAALGVSRARQAGQLSLEHLILSAPAAAVGVLLGAGLAGLLVPAVTVTATAATPVPPVLVQIPLGWAAALAAAVSAVPVLAAAATAARRPDPAAELRAAEAG